MSDLGDADPIDLEIIHVLREDGRIAISDLAARVHVSRANAYARLQRLTDGGTLRGFTAVIDSEKIGFSIHAMVLVSLETWKDRDAIRDRLRSMTEVEFAGATTGQFDLVLVARLRDVNHLRDFAVEQVSEIPGVRSTETAIILEEVVANRAVLPTRQSTTDARAKEV